jgi:hypothetical protein
MSTHNYDLRLEDNDSERKWGGTVRTMPKAVIPGGQLASVATTAPVAELKRDLRAVGIALDKSANGKFEMDTELALREFQIYANMDHVAQEDPASTATEYADKLTQVATGKHKYPGPISGVYNAATRAAMDHWLANHWRCPVVLDVWDMKKKLPTRVGRNVWRRDDDSVKNHVVRARDLSGGFGAQAQTELWDVGTSTKYNGRRGPVVTFEQAAAQAEVLPESLVGQTWAAMAAETRSKFKVVRAVAEVECQAFFDLLNGYDDGVVSLGIFHWIVGLGTNQRKDGKVTRQPDGAGELARILHRIAKENGADYESEFVRFGADVRPAAKAVPRFKLQGEAGDFPEPKDSDEGFNLQRQHVEYLRSWHWFYRFVMLSRNWVALRQVQWKEALERIEEVRGLLVPEEQLDPGKGAARYTLGQVFTSELGIGYLLRWHVNRPANVAKGKQIGSKIADIINRAKSKNPGLAWASAPGTWGDKEELALLGALEGQVADWAAEAEAKKKEKDEAKEKGSYKPGTTAASVVDTSLRKIKTFPNMDSHWTMDRTLVGPLSTKRNSYLFAAPAPPAPAPTPSAPAPSPSAP